MRHHKAARDKRRRLFGGRFGCSSSSSSNQLIDVDHPSCPSRRTQPSSQRTLSKSYSYSRTRPSSSSSPCTMSPSSSPCTMSPSSSSPPQPSPPPPPPPPPIMFAQQGVTSLASLPTELHLAIAETLAEHHPQALASLTLTCRYLSSLCQPLLTSKLLLRAHLNPETYHSTLHTAFTTQGARANTRETPVPVKFDTWHPTGCNNGRTLLHLAVESGSFTATKLLLDHGAKPNAATASCCAETTLHVAARTGDLAITQLLLERGAKVDTPAGGLEVSADCFWGPGATPLIVAVLNDRVDVAQELLRAGADENFCGTPWKCGRRAPVLHYVKSVDMVRVLVEAGAEVNKVDRLGKSVLYKRMVDEGQSAGATATQAPVLRELVARGARCVPAVNTI